MRRMLGALALALACAHTPAAADDWGCEVLLCLANPAGPMAVSQCVPPIRKLWRHLARGRAFPSCAMVSLSGNRQSGTFAQQNFNHYPKCPAGLRPLEPGAYVDTGAGLLAGFGNGDGYTGRGDPRDGAPPQLSQMACVGNLVGTKRVRVGESWAESYEQTVNVYDRVEYLNPSGSGAVIDVYIDGVLFNRVSY